MALFMPGGSSPRVRGTVVQPLHLGLQGRFIPACAGNSSATPSRWCRQPVHPRVCGEQPILPFSARTAIGSSPRVRGTGALLGLAHHALRFIPACAGNSCACDPSRRTWSVHPRVCGEQSVSTRDFFSLRGSSPRVRGTGQDILEVLSIRRFIPACAGNRAEREAAKGGQPVHPRVCGEQLRDKHALIATSGSSPRVRGTD